MRAAFALLAVLAVASCQSMLRSGGAGPTDPVDEVSSAQVQRDVAAIVEGMEQARVDGLRRAGR